MTNKITKPSALALKIATRVRLNIAGDAQDDRESGLGNVGRAANARINRDAAFIDAEIAPLVKALETVRCYLTDDPETVDELDLSDALADYDAMLATGQARGREEA